MHYLIVALLALAPAVSHAQVTALTIIEALTSAIGGLIVAAAAVALMVFIWGVVTFIANSDDENAIVQGKKRMLWGIIGLFLIVSLWGIVTELMLLFGVEEKPGCDATQIDLNGETIEHCDY